ncbi:hypothetical protein ACIDE9_04135 [Methylophilus sp. 'Pure River']|uniref:hypothetical protein n=1 Tax=Methylophilus sp. 'Pure River' TaxID=3377117 RepID=UPI00398EC79A
MSKKNHHEYQNANHWDEVFDREFSKESDRAAVILAGSMCENALGQLLRISLVASPTSNDELMDGANAPLSTFSAKINACYRIGLISRQFTRDLHLIRSIRNKFAHNISGCSFDESSVRSQVLELAKSSGFLERNPNLRHAHFPEGVRGDFMACASWMLYSINLQIEHASSMEEAELEFGYDISLNEEDDLNLKVTKKHKKVKNPKSSIPHA